MNDKSLIRILALLVFISSAIAAFAFAALAYTFVTGEVPLISHSLMDLKKLEADKKIEEVKSGKRIMPEGKSPIRLDEEFLAGFYKDLEKERAKIAEERQRLEGQEKNAKLIMEQAAAMQQKVEAREAQVKDLLKTVDEKERRNVADMQKLMAGMESATALKLLIALDQTLAARILYSMNKKLAAQIVSKAMSGNDKDMQTKIGEITAKMQTLSDELKGDAQK